MSSITFLCQCESIVVKLQGQEIFVGCIRFQYHVSFCPLVPRSISTTASSAGEATEAKKAANEKKDSEERAKLEEFAAKGGVGMELPEAKAAVAAAQRLQAAQAKVSLRITAISKHFKYLYNELTFVLFKTHLEPSPAQNDPGETAISDPKIWCLQAGNSKFKNGKSIYGY